METESGRSGQFTNEQGQFLLACSTVLFDRYRVLKIIHHRGQSATIILAKDTQRDRQVVIKALHAHSVWFNIGLQEARILRQLANADPHKFSRTARLLDVFVYDSHICLVFDALNPKPITQVFKGSSYTHEEKLKNLRKMTLQLLQVAGFLRQNHVIHADLKPENILFKDDDLVSEMPKGIKAALYADDLVIWCKEEHATWSTSAKTNLQTLDRVQNQALRLITGAMKFTPINEMEKLTTIQPLCQRREAKTMVFFGLPFYAEIDMWSIGCILAELYLGKPLIRGTTRVEMVQSMRDVLGPLPRGEFCKGKFYPLLQEFTHHDVDKGHVAVHLFKAFKKLTSQVDHNFVHLLAGLLEYDPAERLTPHQAALHPFLAPEICLSYLMPQHSEEEGLCQLSKEEGEDIQLPSFIHQEMHPSEEEEDFHQLSASSGEESEDLHQLPGILHQKAMPPEDEEEICQLSAPSEEEEEDGTESLYDEEQQPAKDRNYNEEKRLCSHKQQL
ncbi:uncharacterized protein [Littorina saxatilis]|uniref:uncharacterized protein n=1 Tax=Littorina saxatilis TaxID=31220 RepID=UPI0038B4EAB9